MKTTFNKEESMLMMLYSPGSREGLIRELAGMKVQLSPEEKRLCRLTEKVIRKLQDMSDEDFERMDFYPQ